mmetsp:Transcript_22851/g.22114  ORF Transcript_22851/g.22114 Transcript_22851/m.22114 type:complete len:100 (-) Transcript_22851:12-311(-)
MYNHYALAAYPDPNVEGQIIIKFTQLYIAYWADDTDRYFCHDVNMNDILGDIYIYNGVYLGLEYEYSYNAEVFYYDYTPDNLGFAYYDSYTKRVVLKNS